jgi:lysophospholipase L1-like esterase
MASRYATNLYPNGRAYDAPGSVATLTSSVTGLRAGIDKANTWGSSVVCNRTHFPFNGFSSGSSQTTNYRSAHWTKRGGAVMGLKLCFANCTIGATGEATGHAVHTVKASVEYNGVAYPVYFGGTTRTKTLALDEQVTSDPVFVSIPADTKFFVRTYVTVTNLGEKWPVSQAANTAIGEGYASTTDKSDDVSYTSFSAASVYCPSAILGLHAGDAANVLIIGSSSGWGQGDTAETGYWDYGYLSRALSNEYGYVKWTRASTALSHFGTAGYSRFIDFLIRVKPTHVIQQLGSNDLTSAASLATMQSRLNSIWSVCGATGARVYQCTYTPVTTSSDSWATGPASATNNQTHSASHAVRVATNNWIRSVPSSALTGYIECCGAVESSLDSGYWKTTGVAGAYTADGTHLTQLGHRETAASIDMATVLAR